MKILSNVLENIDGIQIYYIVGLLIFFILFVVIIIHTMRRPAREMTEIKESILIEDDSEEIIIS